MNRSDSPSKQPTPFGINGPREPLLSTTPAGDNTASYNSGFPPITMTLKSSGGLPPNGQDMNQILYELSSLCRWASSGALNSFDQEFCTAIAGYPKGSLLLGDDGVTRYISTIDANTNNPNSSSTGWFNLSTAYQPKDAMLTALASLETVNLQFPVFNGPKSIGLGALTNLSLDFLSKSTATEMLSLLSAAPINNPTFTGDPKAPTPAPGDNDTSIATTAFVANALTGYQPQSTQLTEFANVALANYMFPLRNGSGDMQGAALSVLSLDFLSKSTASDMRSVLGLGSASQRDVGTSSGQIPDMGSFTSVKSLIGYQRLPNGTILQWGSGNTTTSGANVSFPIAFPTTCTAICSNERENSVSPVVINFSSVSNTGFTIQAWNTSATRVDSYISWYAIGY